MHLDLRVVRAITRVALSPQGALRNKTQNIKLTGLGPWAWALGWLVGSSDAKKVPGLVRFFCEFFFELPSPRNAQKRDKKKLRKNRFWIFCRFFVKTFRRFFVNRFL
jgi:hypothetical protein